MTLRCYDFRCECGETIESLEPVGKKLIVRNCQHPMYKHADFSCIFKRVVSVPKIVRVDPYVMTHTKRARQRGFDGKRDVANEKAEKEARANWSPKIISCPGNKKRSTL